MIITNRTMVEFKGDIPWSDVELKYKNDNETYLISGEPISSKYRVKEFMDFNVMVVNVEKDLETTNDFWLIVWKTEILGTTISRIYVEWLGNGNRKTYNLNHISHFKELMGEKTQTNEDYILDIIKEKIKDTTVVTTFDEADNVKFVDTRKKKIYDWQSIEHKKQKDNLDNFSNHFISMSSKRTYTVHPDLTVITPQKTSNGNKRTILVELEFTMSSKADFTRKLMKLYYTNKSILFIVRDIDNIDDFILSGKSYEEWESEAVHTVEYLELTDKYINDTLEAKDVFTDKNYMSGFKQLRVYRLSEFLKNGMSNDFEDYSVRYEKKKKEKKIKYYPQYRNLI